MPEPVYRITGGRRLRGPIEVSGAKNAALPCLAAALLTDEPVVLERVPDISDIDAMCGILQALGAVVHRDREAGCIEISAARPGDAGIPDRLARELRGSILFVGPLLARRGAAACAPPGGDQIGERKIDLHAKGFRTLGAQVAVRADGIDARTAGPLCGGRVWFDYPTVSGTENVLMAAVLAAGRTVIVNAASEPEVACLADMLNAMGARISGIGTSRLEIDGVDRLRGVRHRMIPDRIEAGTLAIAAAVTGGEIELCGLEPGQLEPVSMKLDEIGVETAPGSSTAAISVPAGLKAANVQSMPWPGFPTDLQAPVTALLTRAPGPSVVQERVFENRWTHVDPLKLLGADITTSDNEDLITINAGKDAPPPLHGAAVAGNDIRAVAALALAALSAEGESVIRGVEHLNRGYERLDQKLASLGADIQQS